MSKRIFTLFAEHSDATGPAKAVGLVLADHADEHGHAVPGEVRLAVETGLSLRTVKRAIAELDYLGEVKVTRAYDHQRKRQALNRYLVQADVLEGKPGYRERVAWLRGRPGCQTVTQGQMEADQGVRESPRLGDRESTSWVSKSHLNLQKATSSTDNQGGNPVSPLKPPTARRRAHRAPASVFDDFDDEPPF